MNLQAIKNKLKSRAGNDIKAGINDLESQIIAESKLINDLFILKARVESIAELERKGLIDFSAIQLEKNQITNSFLKIVDDMTLFDLGIESDEDTTASPKRNPEKILVLDIDNTVLRKGESLKILGGNHKNLIDIFKQLTSYNYHIVFITGNDIEKQTPRVLEPIAKSGIGEYVTIFSDGGSRLFEYSNVENSFIENLTYSRENNIPEKIVNIIKKEFDEELSEFIEDNGWLIKPDINLHGFELDTEGYFEYSEIVIRPLKRSFYQSPSYEKFKNEIKRLAKKKRISTAISFREVDETSLIIHLEGDNSHTDGFKINNIIREVISHKDFYDLSKPELQIRGGRDFTSQIALKPFKEDDLREKFLNKFIKKIKKYEIHKKLSITLGGRTTIDIQLEGVDKTKAIRFLVDNESYSFNPLIMIYFGNEFTFNGNDFPILGMEEDYRPGLIVHVGSTDRTPKELFDNKHLIIDTNGPDGTINYLRFMIYERHLNKLKNE